MGRVVPNDIFRVHAYATSRVDRRRCTGADPYVPAPRVLLHLQHQHPSRNCKQRHELPGHHRLDSSRVRWLRWQRVFQPSRLARLGDGTANGGACKLRHSPGHAVTHEQQRLHGILATRAFCDLPRRFRPSVTAPIILRLCTYPRCAKHVTVMLTGVQPERAARRDDGIHVPAWPRVSRLRIGRGRRPAYCISDEQLVRPVCVGHKCRADCVVWWTLWRSSDVVHERKDDE